MRVFSACVALRTQFAPPNMCIDSFTIIRLLKFNQTWLISRYNIIQFHPKEQEEWFHPFAVAKYVCADEGCETFEKIKIVSNCDVDECTNDASGWLWTTRLCESYCRNLYFRVSTTHAVDHHKVFEINKINFRLLSYGISANRSKVDLRGSCSLSCHIIWFHSR